MSDVDLSSLGKKYHRVELVDESWDGTFLFFVDRPGYFEGWMSAQVVARMWRIGGEVGTEVLANPYDITIPAQRVVAVHEPCTQPS